MMIVIYTQKPLDPSTHLVYFQVYLDSMSNSALHALL